MISFFVIDEWQMFQFVLNMQYRFKNSICG